MTDRKEKFTPGKWEVADASNGELWICANRSDVIASVYGNSGNVGNANAHLIAAAPEMYEALKDCAGALADLLAKIENGEKFDNVASDCLIAELQDEVEKAVAVLKKARGEE